MTHQDGAVGFTLRDVLSAPFASHLSADPVGDGVAWVLNIEGSRNIWVARADRAEPARPITAYQGDDGFDLGQLRWVPGANAIVYVRGARLDDGAPPNFAGMGPPEIWLVPLDGTGARQLGFGHSAEVSPEGDRVAYVSQGRIWLASLDGADEARPLLRDGGTNGSLSWSPDGLRLAFVSNRSDYAFVGVYDFSAESVQWLAPGIGRDIAPSWSPDGTSIAFIRLEENPEPTYMARPAGKPWSIWIGDPATGAARPIWQATAGAGSVFTPFPFGAPLAWTADAQILFPSETSGWLHLRAVPAAGGPGDDLTPGAFELFGMALDSRRKMVVFAANKGDLDRRHLWRLDLATRQAHALTAGDAVEDGPAITGSGRIVALQASARTPVHPILVQTSGAVRPLQPDLLPPGFPSAELVMPELVTFRSPDGVEVHAQLFLPPSRDRRPAIVHFHGGPARQMLPAWHPMEAYHLQYGLNQYLAGLGYLVLSVNYRGGIGYGLRFREPAGFGAGGASEYQDVLGAAHYLRGRSDVDSRRIGVYGHSYGGLMTALALARASDLFAAGVAYASIADWTPAFAGADVPATVIETAFQSSPLASVDRWRSPALFVHADDDRIVPFAQTIELIAALRARDDVAVDLIVLPDEQHDLLFRRSWLNLLQVTVDFFGRRLRPDGAAR